MGCVRGPDGTAGGFSHQKAQNANSANRFVSLGATVSEAQPTPGRRHIGKYLVKRELGRGGMGAVYLAEQPGLGRLVAIKELLVGSTADPTVLSRFLQEAQVMARTSHPNL